MTGKGDAAEKLPDFPERAGKKSVNKAGKSGAAIPAANGSNSN